MNSFYGKPQGFLLSAHSYTPLNYPLAYGSPPKLGIDGHNNGLGSVTDGDTCGEVDPWDFLCDVTIVQCYLDRLQKWVPSASSRR